jgi:uncharacterized OB-fold protein
MSAVAFSATFLEFIAKGELRFVRNARTGAVLSYTTRPAADERIEWVRAGGGATLHSFAVYRQAYSPEFPVPYNVAMVALDEGPLLLSTVEIDDLARLKVGMRLSARFMEHGRLEFVPA